MYGTSAAESKKNERKQHEQPAHGLWSSAGLKMLIDAQFWVVLGNFDKFTEPPMLDTDGMGRHRLTPYTAYTIQYNTTRIYKAPLYKLSRSANRTVHLLWNDCKRELILSVVWRH